VRRPATLPNRHARHRLARTLLITLLAAAPAANAGDPAAGRQKATTCRPCHGLDGQSRRPDAPHIAGQVEMYLRDQLRKYRSGERPHPVMSVVTQGLSDSDIDDLAAFYAGIRVRLETESGR
jgi:cytochrome c553